MAALLFQCEIFFRIQQGTVGWKGPGMTLEHVKLARFDCAAFVERLRPLRISRAATLLSLVPIVSRSRFLKRLKRDALVGAMHARCLARNGLYVGAVFRLLPNVLALEACYFGGANRA